MVELRRLCRRRLLESGADVSGQKAALAALDSDLEVVGSS